MTKPFKIWIEDKKTFEKVVKQMDKDGIRWVIGECASYRIDLYPVPIALFVDSDNILSWGSDKLYLKNPEYNEITPEEYLKENNTMTKADLKDWMIVEDNLESKYFVDRVHNYFLQYDDAGQDNHIIDMNAYNDELYSAQLGRYITKVFRPSVYIIAYILDGDCNISRLNDSCLIWERSEPAVEMTVAEIEEKLGIKNLKIVKENEDD